MKRIRRFLQKRGLLLAWIILFLVMLLFGMSAGLRDYWLCAGFTAGVLVFSWAYMLIARSTLQISQSLERETLVSGGEADFSVEIHNRFFLMVPLVQVWCLLPEISPRPRRQAVAGIMPHSSYVSAFPMRGTLKGTYSVGLTECEMSDFLGLVHLTVRLRGRLEPRKVWVMPRIHTIAMLPIPPMEGDTHSSRTMNSQAQASLDVRDIRKYIQGDPLKIIDWRTSVRMGELHVKEFQQNRNMDLVVQMLVNPSCDLAMEHHLCEIVLSIVGYGLAHGFTARLMLGERILFFCRDEQDLAQLRMKLTENRLASLEADTALSSLTAEDAGTWVAVADFAHAGALQSPGYYLFFLAASRGEAAECLKATIQAHWVYVLPPGEDLQDSLNRGAWHG